eukprot:TRINITY_DN4746_c0_g1_i2.p1 TRINITY_DN4746_c0_g1~~TRINITY_DN4746_c0_g1_i2.p1  ORF type:complete len:761 (+),score=103.19 TRINITY_DN4746_c0_g1_i2:36-2318(+)
MDTLVLNDILRELHRRTQVHVAGLASRLHEELVNEIQLILASRVPVGGSADLIKPGDASSTEIRQALKLAGTRVDDRTNGDHAAELAGPIEDEIPLERAGDKRKGLPQTIRLVTNFSSDRSYTKQPEDAASVAGSSARQSEEDTHCVIIADCDEDGELEPDDGNVSGEMRAPSWLGGYDLNEQYERLAGSGGLNVVSIMEKVNAGHHATPIHFNNVGAAIKFLQTGSAPPNSFGNRVSGDIRKMMRVTSMVNNLRSFGDVALVDRAAFSKLMTQSAEQLTNSLSNVHVAEDIDELQRLFQTEADQHMTLALVDRLKVDTRRERRPKIMFELIPACAIILNAVTLGLAQDLDGYANLWNGVEMGFVVIYLLEFLIKVRILSFKTFFHNGTAWDAWNCFDAFCLLASVVDLVVAFAVSQNEKEGANALMLLKIFRVARLARLVRMINNPLLTELKVMILGVLAGLRTLFWAFVLLIFIIFILAVVIRIFLKSESVEIGSLLTAMFFLFRCFMGDCAARNGTPLIETLSLEFGLVFRVSYVALTMLVSMGLFNLITAVFIDNVSMSQNRRRLDKIAKSTKASELRLKKLVSALTIEYGKRNHDSRVARALLSHRSTDFSSGPSGKAQESLFKRLAEYGITISQELFGEWLTDADFLEVLEDCDIACSNKEEMFDILAYGGNSDAVSISDIVRGLMQLRGPVSKGDITSIMVKVNHIVHKLDRLDLNGSNMQCAQSTDSEDPQMLRAKALPTKSSSKIRFEVDE